MFSVFAEEGRLAIASTLLFAAAAFCARTARPAVKRYRAAAAAIAARMMFVIVHLVMGTTEPGPTELQLRLRPAGLALRELRLRPAGLALRDFGARLLLSCRASPPLRGGE